MKSDELPMPFPGWENSGTPAMAAGDQHMNQCAHCGAVLMSRVKRISGTCPSCLVDKGWWHQPGPWSGGEGGSTLAGWHLEATS